MKINEFFDDKAAAGLEDQVSLASNGYSDATVRMILAAAKKPGIGPMSAEEAMKYIRSIKPNHEQKK